jgi:serine/threonine protein kinase
MTPDSRRGAELEIAAGEVLCGRYRVDRMLGRSETGVVVAATDLARGGGVAIKMIEPAGEETDLVAARLRREAHVLAQLTSPHVVRVFDVDKHAHAVCLVMELLEGSNLAQLVRKRGPLPIEEAVGLVVQACDGLADAHSLGIVHRDVKPQNLFLAQRPDGTAILKVLDFGVSKQHGGAMGLTGTGAAVGSPLYTAVEQFRDASRVDTRADIWSIGLVLYFLLCRRHAFDADNLVALMLKIATVPPSPLRERRPDAPADLEAIILQCVEKDRARRFQTVGAFARALVPFGPPWTQAFLASIDARLAGRGSLPSLPPVGPTPGSPSTSPGPNVPRIGVPSFAVPAPAPGQVQVQLQPHAEVAAAVAAPLAVNPAPLAVNPAPLAVPSWAAVAAPAAMNPAPPALGPATSPAHSSRGSGAPAVQAVASTAWADEPDPVAMFARDRRRRLVLVALVLAAVLVFAVAFAVWSQS